MLLNQIISRVESSQNSKAMRFEPAMFASAPLWAKNQVGYVQKANGIISTDTALMIACTSWGEFQLLGANIYAYGEYARGIFDYLSDPNYQLISFADFIRPHGFNAQEDCAEWFDQRYINFATFYNGPGAVQSYIAAMKAAQG